MSVTLLALSLLSGPAQADDCLLIQGATVYLPDGPSEDTSVRVRGARIVQVGAGLSADGCAVMDGAGGHLTAGFVESTSSLGLVEVNQVAGTHDDRGHGPAFRAAEGYNPRSTLIPVARLAGVTSAVATPAGGGIAGQSAWVDLAGSTQAEAVRRSDLAMHTGVGNQVASSLNELRQLLDDARVFARNPRAFDDNRTRPLSASRQDLAALQPLLNRDMPLVIGVNRASDIEAVLAFAREQRLKVVLLGAAEGWLVAEQLAQAKVPVILDPLVYGPGSFDQVHARPDNAALLQGAGVTVVFTTRSAHNARLLGQVAGNAVREGLPHHEALLAITQNPADVFGMGDHGRVQAGAMANLVLWSGDPLELSSSPTAVMVAGEQQALVSRHTLLRDRYIEGTAILTSPSVD